MFFSFTDDEELSQFNIQEPTFESAESGHVVRAQFKLTRKPTYMIMNSYLPSFLTMVMTIAALFLNDRLHFGTTITLVLTSQLCLYTLIQSSLEGIPKTGYIKFIDCWNMFTTTITLSNFFILFFWEILQYKGINKWHKNITRIFICLITTMGVVSYLIVAKLQHSGLVS